MPDVEERLSLLGPELDWPVTPQFAYRVTARIAIREVRRPWFQSRWVVAVAAVVVALAALLAYTPARDTIAHLLNIHTSIQRVTELPTPTPLPPGPLGERLGLGGGTTLSGARGAVLWRVLVPASLGTPDEVYLQASGPGPPEGEVTLVYQPRPGIKASGTTGVGVLVTEARGAANKDFFGKMLGPGTTLEDVTVGRHQGYWIAGQPHIFFLTDASGAIRDETLRLATNTLIIDYGGTVVRIEGDLTKAQALQIAQSLGA